MAIVVSPQRRKGYSSKRPEGNAEGLVEVQPRVTIRSVSEVDVKAQTFEMDVQIELQWEDDRWLRIMEQASWIHEAEEHGWQEQMRNTCWHPGLVLNNCKEMMRDEVWFRTDARRIYFVTRVHALFRTRYRLHNFPFDMQWLTVRMASSFEFVRFVTDGEGQKDFLDRATFILEEYRHANYICVQSCPANREESSSAIRYQALNVKVAVQREYSYYVTNVFFIDLCLVCSSLLVLLVPASQFEDRMGLSLTLLLTAVAFKELVNTYLPPISYSTILDKYVLCGFVMQVLVVVQNAIAKVEAGEDGRWAFADTLGCVFLFAYLVLYHLWAGFKIRKAIRKDANYWVDYFRNEVKKPTRYMWHRVHALPKPTVNYWRTSSSDGELPRGCGIDCDSERIEPQLRERQLRAANLPVGLGARLLRSVLPRMFRPAPKRYVKMPECEAAE